MIYSPTYLGNHSYSYYDHLAKELKGFLEIEFLDLIIDIDLLHNAEVNLYFEDIFCTSYIMYYRNYDLERKIHIQTKDSKRLTIARKNLRKFMINYSKTFRINKKYKIRVSHG